MNGKEMLNSVLAGSENIDRMRAEIHKLIDMLRGSILKIDPELYKFNERKEFANDCCAWEIEEIPEWKHRRATKDIIINCWKYHGKHFGSLAWSTTHVAEISTKNAKFIRENLFILLEGILNIYPDINEHWQPLIDAADFYTK